MVAHGYVRFTADVDLVIDLEPDKNTAACWMEVASGVSASFVGRAELIALKRGAGRPQDLEDVRRLLEDDKETGA